MSTWDWPGDKLVDDEATETTLTPRRAGVTVSESDDSLDIDGMLLFRRFAEITGSPAATGVKFLILDGNSSDWMLLELPLLGDDDVLLMA